MSVWAKATKSWSPNPSWINLLADMLSLFHRLTFFWSWRSDPSSVLTGRSTISQPTGGRSLFLEEDGIRRWLIVTISITDHIIFWGYGIHTHGDCIDGNFASTQEVTSARSTKLPPDWWEGNVVSRVSRRAERSSSDPDQVQGRACTI